MAYSHRTFTKLTLKSKKSIMQLGNRFCVIKLEGAPSICTPREKLRVFAMNLDHHDL